MEAARARLLGQYRLLAELGRGGAGIVYSALADGPGGSRPVVVKELWPDLANDDAFLRVFLDEMRLSSRLDHPNVARTYEVGNDAGCHYVVAEHFEGQTLRRTVATLRRKGQAMPRPLQLRVLSEALLGLHYAHELRGPDGAPLGIVHRGVNPRSVFLTYDGQVKLVDFGIARSLEVASDTSTGALERRTAYMAPEQVQGAPDVDRRVDVFSVGVMLWEALVGHKLWRGVPNYQMLARLAKGELPASPSTVVDGVPRELDEICAAAMGAQREARYPTALAFREAIERYIVASGEGATTYDVGVLVSSTFARERPARPPLLGGNPSHPANSADGGYAISSSGEASSARRGLTPSIVTQAPGSARPSAEPPPAPRAAPPQRVLLAGAAVVVASATLTTGAVLATRGVPRPARAAASAAPPPSAVALGARAGAPKAAAGPLVTLKVHVSPAHARVLLDGEEIPPEARAGVTRVRDGRPHQVQAEAEGYLPRVQPVTFDHAELNVDLELAKPTTDAAKSPPTGQPAPGAAPHRPRHGAPTHRAGPKHELERCCGGPGPAAGEALRARPAQTGRRETTPHAAGPGPPQKRSS
ncbi:MAG TPA: serine/threonine-protein kinase [Polyangiaceae bacterium]|nr:serine/threonine-protein kinase [Polyangiaceae bacterium]